MAVGGDIIEITWNHPTLGSGVLYPKAGEDNAYNPGGVQTASDVDMIDGGANPIWSMGRKRGYFSALIANDQNQGQELEKMIALSGDPVPADWTFSIINGCVYGGKGKPVGDMEGNINKATFPLRVESGKFKKIVG
jgi:hypothetical protein